LTLDNKEKRHPHDFALWKSKKEENEPSWNAPWGFGRPGWHIECSTLASIAFDNHLDFHSGGKDLLFPHHHNEMTQCCAYFNINKWSSLWLHTGHLHLKGEVKITAIVFTIYLPNFFNIFFSKGDVKMSKSLSNTILIKDLLKTYSSNQFRLFCLLSSYRSGNLY
jgi:cysteinyl-tRNA synthetase